MKRIIAILLAIIMAFGVCFAEQPIDTEPMVEYVEVIEEIAYEEIEDVIEIADDDCGYVEEFIPRAFLDLGSDTLVLYSQVTLTAILIDFPPERTITWECSQNGTDWQAVQSGDSQTYTFTLTPDNLDYLWRLSITYEG